LKIDYEQSAAAIDSVRSLFEGRYYLSITQAALYLGVSRPTVYKRIKKGDLTPLRVSSRAVRISVDQLRTEVKQKPLSPKGDFSCIISKQEALARYDVTVQWLYRCLAAEGIKPMVINGKAYFPKNDLDRLLPPKVAYNPNDWYDAYDLMRSEGLTRKYISDFIRRKKVPSRRNGHSLLIARREWDNARTSRGILSSSYLTVESARKRYHISQKTFYDAIRENNLQCIRQNRCAYYNIQDLNRLFKNKKPRIPPGIRREYIRGRDALKKYHVGQKRFSEMTKAAGVTKIRTKGNYVWYKKTELDTLFFMINSRI
jgi:excisionase family DNA binding protein